MAEIDSTRLRFIRAGSPEEISAIVSSLPFKVEIKGGVVKDGKKWIIFFIIPEIFGLEFNNLEL